MHRTIAGELAGRAVMTIPNTYLQAQLDLRSPDLEFAAEPAGFAVHAVLDGEVVSHMQPVV